MLQLNPGNLFPYMIYAKAHMFSALLSGTVAYCRKLFRTVKHPRLFEDEDPIRDRTNMTSTTEMFTYSNTLAKPMTAKQK